MAPPLFARRPVSLYKKTRYVLQRHCDTFISPQRWAFPTLLRKQKVLTGLSGTHHPLFARTLTVSLDQHRGVRVLLALRKLNASCTSHDSHTCAINLHRCVGALHLGP